MCESNSDNANNWNEVSATILSATCQQGSTLILKSVSARIVLLLTFLSLMFLHSSFSANIVGLIQSPSTRIQTLTDLLESRIQVGYHNLTMHEYYMQVPRMIRIIRIEI